MYDESLGEELKRKYRHSTDVVVCEKSYVGLNDGIHHYTFAGVDLSNFKPSEKAAQWVETRPGRKVLVLDPDKGKD